MQVAAKRFFQAPYFAVAGASQDRSKFGYKSRLRDLRARLNHSERMLIALALVLAWYQQHSLAVQPINPRSSSITLSNPNVTLPTVANLGELPHPKETSLSVVTPPSVTRQLLQEAQELGIKAVWLQPGTFDEALLKWVGEEERFESFVANEVEKTGAEGWCVLIHGEAAIKAGKEESKERL